MEIYAKWVYGKHPTDEMIMRYISEGALYFCERNGSVISAAAVTPYQGEDYHNTSWSLRLADDETAVVHILCVEPKLQKQGIARETMELIIGLSRKLEKRRCGWTLFQAISLRIAFMNLLDLLKWGRSVGTQIMWA